MSSNTTSCPLCAKKVSWAGLGKHITALEHREQLHDAFSKIWNFTRIYTKDTCYGLPYFATKDGAQVFVCFGCKTAGRRGTYSEHLRDCPHAAIHRDTLKGMFREQLDVSGNAIVKPLEGNDAAAFELAKQQLEKAEKKLKKLEASYDKLQDQVLENDDILEECMKRFMGMSYVGVLKKNDEAKETGEEVMTYTQLLAFYKEHSAKGCGAPGGSEMVKVVEESKVEGEEEDGQEEKGNVIVTSTPSEPAEPPKAAKPLPAVPVVQPVITPPLKRDWSDKRNQPTTEEEMEEWLAFQRRKAEERHAKEQQFWEKVAPSHPVAAAAPAILSSTLKRGPKRVGVVQ